MNDRADRARRLHREAIVIDTHNDTVLELLLCPHRDFARRGDWLPAGVTAEEATGGHYNRGDGQLDLPRALAGGLTAGFFVITCGDSVRGIAGTFEAIGRLEREAEQSPDKLLVATGADDIRRAKAEGRLAAVMSVEGGLPADAPLSMLQTLYERGVRCAAFSFYVGGDGQLTDFGKAYLAEIGQLGMMVDVCHLPSSAFWEAMERTEGAVIDSHTNAWALEPADGRRNRRDDEAEALAERGGVIGVNSYPTYVGGDPPSLARLVDHIDHFAQVAGPDHVGLGLDFDGMHAFSPVLRDVAEMPRITEELVRRGYGDVDVGKIVGGNWLRVIEQVLGC